MACPVYLVCLLFISGVVAQDWRVKYNPSYLCALKGSTVTMDCTYTYPRGHMVVTAFWSKQLVTANFEPPDLSSDPKYRNRMKYLGDKQNSCRFQLSDVREEDRSKYYFRFITNQLGGKWQGTDGITLYVTDLRVDAPERVKEGAAVTLTCKTSCSLTDSPTFIWYKNGRQLTSSKISQINLQQVSSEDAGSYSCSVLGHRHHSPAVTLQVSYPPKRVSVSISPSGEVVENSSVTLTCSSDANPPAEYLWFKRESLVSKGDIYRIDGIMSEHSGDYKCKAMNKYGEKYSDALMLNVVYPPKNVSVSISSSGEVVEGSSVTLTCSSDANPPVVNYTWYKDNKTSPVGSGQSFRAVESGSYYCEAQNGHGAMKAKAVLVTFKGKVNVVLYAAIGVTVGCGCLLVIIGILIVRSRTSGNSDDSPKLREENIYCNVEAKTTDNHPTADTNQGRVEDSIPYATVRFTSTGSASRSDDAGSEEPSVIYCSVK